MVADELLEEAVAREVLGRLEERAEDLRVVAVPGDDGAIKVAREVQVGVDGVGVVVVVERHRCRWIATVLATTCECGRVRTLTRAGRREGETRE